ncbi:helix-turn-helix domain-containing protein [Streptomyces sp. H27-S2]|uniref:helix-turn-helix domain-containing protein n=1 Tax=Streptomyces antarcticus TaxID=2996458 RepID=UPI0022720071|nr:helix-turn-helix transcriptional regulator [Streptomyces sp. H27-S2]MCY0953551.1 helix-turn-helix transcriptional regulator [Streptomyces sp. H27-S2]
MRVVSFSVPAWFPPQGEQARPRAQLTEQESAVFLCLATGASNAELAVELRLSVSTVKFHVVNIRAKLGGISRLQACLLAALAREDLRTDLPDADLPDADLPDADLPDADLPVVAQNLTAALAPPLAPGGPLSGGGAAAVPR